MAATKWRFIPWNLKLKTKYASRIQRDCSLAAGYAKARLCSKASSAVSIFVHQTASPVTVGRLSEIYLLWHSLSIRFGRRRQNTTKDGLCATTQPVARGRDK